MQSTFHTLYQTDLNIKLLQSLFLIKGIENIRVIRKNNLLTQAERKWNENTISSDYFLIISFHID